MNPPLPSRIRVIAQALNAQYDDGVLDYYRYRCCCRSCHVKYGALAIGVFEVLVMAYHFASCLILLIREDIAAHTASTAITMVGIALALGAVACVFYGVIKQKPLFVLPHLILQVRVEIGYLEDPDVNQSSSLGSQHRSAHQSSRHDGRRFGIRREIHSEHCRLRRYGAAQKRIA